MGELEYPPMGLSDMAEAALLGGPLDGVLCYVHAECTDGLPCWRVSFTRATGVIDTVPSLYDVNWADEVAYSRGELRDDGRWQYVYAP